MQSQSLYLINSTSMAGSTPANGTSYEWQGGRTMFSLAATVYASGAIYLQTQLPGGAAWFNVGGPYGANQYTSMDLARGQYKIINGASSSLGVFAVLSSVPYA